MTKTAINYQQAGVNINMGNRLVDIIKPLSQKTHRTGVMQSLGGFGALFDIKACGFDDPILVSGSDGVGTKLLIALDMDDYSGIGIDLVAMCVNDIIVQGAQPLFFMDYYACGQLHNQQAEKIIESITQGCIKANIALIGGETAELPSLYHDGHFDLAGFCVGAVERDNLLPKQNITDGDMIIGIASQGIHSNGFSLVRSICQELGLDYHAPCPFDDTKILGTALLQPTEIYVSIIMDLLNHFPIKALSHITGGGLVENPQRVLPEYHHAQINIHSWELPPVFQWLRNINDIDDNEFYKTFNNGIGMVVYCDKNMANTIQQHIIHKGYDAYIIGEVCKNNIQKPTVILER